MAPPARPLLSLALHVYTFHRSAAISAAIVTADALTIQNSAAALGFEAHPPTLAISPGARRDGRHCGRRHHLPPPPRPLPRGRQCDRPHPHSPPPP